jgi:IclR family pca regulon transcriptional regulator
MPKIASDAKTRTTRTAKAQRAGIADPLPLPATAAAEIQARSGDPNFMTSLARGLVVIQAFSQQKRNLTIAQISHKTGIPRAAVRRCLYTLAQLGYVSADDGRNFALRPKILALGHAYLSSGRLATSAQPLLEHVSRTVHESCSMAILEGDDILYVARSSTTTRIVSIDLGVGSRLPAFCTSMGRVLLADLSPNELEGYLARVRLTPFTNRTLSSPDKLKKMLNTVRTSGYALIDQELEIGLRSIAVPVKDLAGKVVAALNVGTQASRIPLAEMQTKFLPPLRAAAHELGMLLLP